MVGLNKQDNAQRHKHVVEAVKDHLAETGKFASIEDISNRSGLSKSICRQVAATLARQDQLYVAYEAPNRPTIYGPPNIGQTILRAQPKPKWVSEYQFPERSKAEKQMKGAENKLAEFDNFERLLYATGEPLDEAVAFTLSSLKFDEVKLKPYGSNKVNVTFKFKGHKFVCEITGKGKHATKEDILQLHSWIQDELHQPEVQAGDLKGLFFINHYRHQKPPERPEALTDEAKKYAQWHQFRVISTPVLFDIIRKVREGLAKEEARRLIVEGEDL